MLEKNVYIYIIYIYKLISWTVNQILLKMLLCFYVWNENHSVKWRRRGGGEEKEQEKNLAMNATASLRFFYFKVQMKQIGLTKGGFLKW